MSGQRLQPKLQPSRGGWAIIIAIALGLGAWVTATSPIFDIDRIDVSGNARLSAEQVVALSGTRTGENLLLLSLGDVETRLRRSPWVAGAEVRRDLPSRLVIRLDERRAVAWVRQGSGGALLAGDGVVVELTASPPALPRLDVRVPPLEVGARAPALGVLLRVAASFPPRLQRLVREVKLEGADVELLLQGDIPVHYGRAQAMRPKNGAIVQMLRYAKEEGLEVEYLDVRAPTAPALKPVGAAPQAAVAPSPEPTATPEPATEPSPEG